VTTEPSTPDLAAKTEEDYEEARTYLKERFAAWGLDEGVSLDDDAGETMIHYKWGYLDGDLAHWSRRDLDEIYLELLPQKMIAEEPEFDAMLEEAKYFVRFMSEAGLLDPESEPVEVLVAHLDKIAPRFRRYMGDPARYSFGKRLWSSAVASGVQLDDEEAVSRFMSDFNSRSYAERQSILGRNLEARTGRFTPKGTTSRPKGGRR
jgi:hypothetical protein